MAMLEALSSAPGGAALFAQIERSFEMRGALQGVIEQAFYTFVRNALARYVRTTQTDRITLLKLRLVEQRLAALTKSSSVNCAMPELPDTTALAQHVVAQLWSASQATAARPASSHTAVKRAERLKPLQQTLETQLDRAIMANLDSIASLGSVELTLKGAQPGELEEWREILRDAAREIIDDYRRLGEDLRQARLYATEIGTELAAPPATGSRVADDPELMRRLEGEMRRAQRYRHPLSLAMLGPDNLEDIKLLVGAQAASEVLQRYRDNILSCARAYDTVSNCNPHKLLWVLPGADPDQSVKALHKVRERVTTAHYHYGGRLRPLPTFSAGVVAFTPGESSSRFLARADVLATRARQEGPSQIKLDRRQPSIS